MRSILIPLLLAATLGCNDEDTTSPLTAEGTTVVSVLNGSSVAMTDVSVTPGPGAQVITSSRLTPLQSTNAVTVDALHENPIVRATVDGREYTLHPVEGFVPGWNPKRPEGRYVVVLTYDAENRLSVVVQSADR